MLLCLFFVKYTYCTEFLNYRFDYLIMSYCRKAVIQTELFWANIENLSRWSDVCFNWIKYSRNDDDVSPDKKTIWKPINSEIIAIETIQNDNSHWKWPGLEWHSIVLQWNERRTAKLIRCVCKRNIWTECDCLAFEKFISMQVDVTRVT